jgi:urease beta subunit
MAIILIKKKDTAGVPGSGDLTNSTGGAEIAVNTADKRLYVKNSGGSVVELGTNPATLQVNSAFTFPTSDGTNGQVLSTNGSGTVTWSNAASGDVTTTGTQTLTNKTLTDPAIIGTILEDVYTISDGAAFEIDPGNGSVQLITLGASRTPKATNFAAGESVMLMVDDGSAYTLTWTDSTFGGSGVVWKTDAGVAPTLNTTGYTAIVLWKVSTQVYGARVGDA